MTVLSALCIGNKRRSSAPEVVYTAEKHSQTTSTMVDVATNANIQGTVCVAFNLPKSNPLYCKLNELAGSGVGC